MNIEQLEYRVRTSPNLDYKYQGDKLLVGNKLNGNKVLFANDSIKKLFDYFKNPKIIHEAIKEIYGDESRNIEIIKNLIEWDFLITDLELKERQCPFCNSNNHIVLVEHQNDYYKTTFKYVKCQECDLVYLNPCPSEKALDFFYAFINYYSIIPINSINKLDQRLIRKSNILRSQILKNYKHIDKTTSILDVGAGVGSFAIYLKKKFDCNVYCSDKDIAAVEFINKSYPKINTISGDFKKIKPKYKFDIITMWGFLEHEFDPVGTLRLAREMLKPNGIIILDVPNIKGNLAKKNIKNWPFLHSPYHICHYNLDTLSKIIEQVGFHFVHSENKKTGAFLLKYSDQILSIIYKYNLFYSSKYVDFIFYLLSRIFMKGEANSDSRIIIIGQK